MLVFFTSSVKRSFCCQHINLYQVFCCWFHMKVSLHMELILSQGDHFLTFYFILQEKQLLIKSAEYTCLIVLTGLTVVLNHTLIVCSGRDDSTRGIRNAAYLSPVIPRDHMCDTSRSYSCNSMALAFNTFWTTRDRSSLT